MANSEEQSTCGFPDENINDLHCIFAVLRKKSGRFYHLGTTSYLSIIIYRRDIIVLLGKPYMLVGVIFGEKDGDNLRASMDKEIDCMMKTVRSEKKKEGINID